MQFFRPALRYLHRPLLQHPSIASALASTRAFSTTFAPRALASPLNLPKWLEENSHLLKPPINNYCVYNDNVTVMIVGGPNERTDYHINETAEWFYQYKGNMLLKTVDEGKFRDIVINEGEMFLLPPNTPHNPVRFANTVGIVLEQSRPAGSLDRLRWYCQDCGEQVHEASFHCTDLGTQIKDAVNKFKADKKARTCNNCGSLCDVAPRPRKC
ncbi:3-hydroxyanthranilate 3,4-dioxygenase [Glonium stellatum]|uniref:3-hydroxyanthranilate 3,4-dioxygenase n=1 Tax=Glonium stellatum TaxID=574774 RepID=A0A8E2ENP7_9PEZI|nr:3-hydroxyanthranilate 3,4-dioxygenase [Glonium stellatum]